MAKKYYGKWCLGYICQKCNDTSNPRGSILTVCPECGYRGSNWKAVVYRNIYIKPWWLLWCISKPPKESVEIKPDDPEAGSDEYAMPSCVPVENTEI
jgi:hypothetical protein